MSANASTVIVDRGLLEQANKVTGKSVAYLDQLHYKDGDLLLEQLKRDAEAAGIAIGGVR